MRILVVDDHELVRTGVKTLLNGMADWEVCGEASNGKEAVKKAAELKPDVAILDLSMPIMGGIEAARVIRSMAPQTRIILLSMHDPIHIAAVAKSAGLQIDACISKSSVATELTITLATLDICCRNTR